MTLDPALVLRLYEVERLSLRAIARRFGTNHITLGRLVRKAGRAVRSSYDAVPRKPLDQDWLLAEYEAGASLHVLARRLNCSHSHVRDELVRSGRWKPRRRGRQKRRAAA